VGTLAADISNSRLRCLIGSRRYPAGASEIEASPHPLRTGLQVGSFFCIITLIFWHILCISLEGITFRRDAFPVPIVDCIVGCPFRFGLSIVDRAVGYRFRYPWLSIIDCWLPIVFVRWLFCTTAVVFL